MAGKTVRVEPCLFNNGYRKGHICFLHILYVLMLFWGEVNNCKSWLVCSCPNRQPHPFQSMWGVCDLASHFVKGISAGWHKDDINGITYCVGSSGPTNVTGLRMMLSGFPRLCIKTIKIYINNMSNMIKNLNHKFINLIRLMGSAHFDIFWRWKDMSNFQVLAPASNLEAKGDDGGCVDVVRVAPCVF